VESFVWLQEKRSGDLEREGKSAICHKRKEKMGGREPGNPNQRLTRLSKKDGYSGRRKRGAREMKTDSLEQSFAGIGISISPRMKERGEGRSPGERVGKGGGWSNLVVCVSKKTAIYCLEKRVKSLNMGEKKKRGGGGSVKRVNCRSSCKKTRHNIRMSGAQYGEKNAKKVKGRPLCLFAGIHIILFEVGSPNLSVGKRDRMRARLTTGEKGEEGGGQEWNK